MISILALFPISLIDEGWKIINENISRVDPRIEELLNYVSNMWLISNNSVFGREVLSHNDKTNNACEGFYTKFNRSLNKSIHFFLKFWIKLKNL